MEDWGGCGSRLVKYMDMRGGERGDREGRERERERARTGKNKECGREGIKEKKEEEGSFWLREGDKVKKH